MDYYPTRSQFLFWSLLLTVYSPPQVLLQLNVIVIDELLVISPFSATPHFAPLYPLIRWISGTAPFIVQA